MADRLTGYSADESCCNSTYRLRYWNYSFSSIMLSYLVATVLTVYGIETTIYSTTTPLSGPLQQYLPFTVLKLIVLELIFLHNTLQQYLPFTVLKHSIHNCSRYSSWHGVATVLTVYGIETLANLIVLYSFPIVATVLTVYGIETTVYKMCEIVF